MYCFFNISIKKGLGPFFHVVGHRGFKRGFHHRLAQISTDLKGRFSSWEGGSGFLFAFADAQEVGQFPSAVFREYVPNSSIAQESTYLVHEGIGIL
jgi:hypothetical protein